MKAHLSPVTSKEAENCVMPECPICEHCEFGTVVYPDYPFTDFFDTYCSCTKEKKKEWLAKNGEAWKKHCKENGFT